MVCLFLISYLPLWEMSIRPNCPLLIAYLADRQPITNECYNVRTDKLEFLSKSWKNNCSSYYLPFMDLFYFFSGSASHYHNIVLLICLNWADRCIRQCLHNYFILIFFLSVPDDWRGIPIYQITDVTATWYDARSFCLNQGGDLFFLKQRGNMRFLKKKLSLYQDQRLFIGLAHRIWQWEGA